MAPLALSHDEYTVAWICALPLEMAAAKTMLEEIHGRLPQPSTDHNAYTLGRVHGHNVAIACLPSGIYGTTSATAALTQMLPTFPSLRFGLMVGIGGGVPGKADVRLGDVVISKPTASGSGVIQYDYGKTMRDGCIQRTGFLNKPPQVLLTAISQIESDHIMGQRQIKKNIDDVLEKNKEMRDQFSQPKDDWLFRATYPHEDNARDCSSCDLNQLSHRRPRITDEPHVHYGLVASGNQVMKDAQTRDQIAQELDIICFEMEAAGLMDQLPCLVIRGICDYCDSHKHKEWQGYAALTAATYTKSLLSEVPAVVPTGGPEKNVGFTTDEYECLRSLFLTNPADIKNALKRKKGDRADGTCEWILKTEELSDWLEGSENNYQNESNIFWLHGNPGTGKSTMVITMTDELPKQPVFTSGNKVLAYFFCDSSEEKQRTAISILRGLLYQLIHQRPRLIKYLLAKFLDRKESLFTSFDALWEVLMEMGADSSCEIYCMIDALDECESDSQQTLLRQIYQSFEKRGVRDSLSSDPYILITSRPYPEIRENLSHFRCKDLGSYSAVKQDIKIMIDEKVHDLSKRKNYPKRVIEEVSRILEEKAEGTFLWVGIACGELDQPRVQARNAVETLRKMPRGLYALYDQLLRTALADGDDDDEKNIMQMLKYIVCVRRPLTLPELTSLCQFYPDEDESSRLQFTRDVIGSCRLMIIIQEGRVQLLHKSVKDFLVKEQERVDDRKSQMELVDQCISHMLRYLEFPSSERGKGAFFKYAVEYWPEHSELAGNAFMVREHHESFFKFGSRTWKLWLQEYNSTTGNSLLKLEEGFCVFHAAARWGIVPLVSWVLAAKIIDSGSVNPVKRKYDDKSMQTMTGITPLEEAAKRGSMTILKVLLESLESGAELKVKVVKAAAGNRRSGKEIMTLLLDQRGDQIPITEEVVKVAAENWRSGKEIMTLLLNRRGDQIPITEEVIEAAARNSESGKDIMTLLLDRREDQIPITEEVVKVAAENWRSGKEIMTLLLDRRGDQVPITEEVVKTTARNSRSGKEIMTLLLDRRGDQVPISEEVVKVAGENWRSGKEIMTLLLDRREDQIPITEEVVKAAAGNSESGKEIMTLLLDRRGDQVPITEEVVEAAARNSKSGKDIMTLLLDRRGDQIPITEEVVKVAAENWRSGKEIMTLLLDRRGDQVPITEEVVKAAAGDGGSEKEIITLLLDQQEDQVPITEEVVKAAAENSRRRKEIMTLLLDRRGDQIPITEEVVKVAAENWRSGKEIMTLLLNRRRDQVPITEEVVEAAARNSRSGKDIMTLLLDRRGDQILITEEVVKAAARNSESGKEIITLLLDRRGDQVPITEEVIKTTARNSRSGKEIMTLLLDQREDQIFITEEIVKATAGNSKSGKEIMTLLLDRQGEQIPITEEVIKVAAENDGSGKEIMTLLLDRRGEQIPITEEVVEAAARNSRSGKEIMTLLLDRRGDQVPISEEVVKVAAGNSESGKDILSILCERYPDMLQSVLTTIPLRHEQLTQNLFRLRHHKGWVYGRTKYKGGI